MMMITFCQVFTPVCSKVLKVVQIPSVPHLRAMPISTIKGKLFSLNKSAKDFLQKIGVANPLNPPAVVIRRSVYEELGGYHPELTATLDWELYKRVSTFYDWWYEPDILVHYRQHSKSMRTGLLVTGTRTKSIRRSIEISETYLPHSLVKEVTAKARQCYFEMCLEDIAVPLKAGNVDGALLMLREVLKINHSPAAIEKLFHWLTEDKAVDLRAAIVQKLISNPINATLKS